MILNSTVYTILFNTNKKEDRRTITQAMVIVYGDRIQTYILVINYELIYYSTPSYNYNLNIQ